MPWYKFRAPANPHKQHANRTVYVNAIDVSNAMSTYRDSRARSEIPTNGRFPDITQLNDAEARRLTERIKTDIKIKDKGLSVYVLDSGAF